MSAPTCARNAAADANTNFADAKTKHVIISLNDALAQIPDQFWRRKSNVAFSSATTWR